MVEALPPQAVAIVTGAAGGIGSAITAALSVAGLRVLATDLQEPSAGTLRLAADLTRCGVRAAALRRGGGRARACLGARAQRDGVAARHLHAGADRPGRPDDDAPRRDDLRPAVRGRRPGRRAPHRRVRRAAARARRRGGRIVTLTSGGAGFPGEVSYGAAKAALVDLTLSAALELSADGVTANAVHPPVTDTGWVNDEVRAVVAAEQRFFTVAAPEEVAEVIAFLASDAGRRVTGNVIRMG